MNKKIIPYGKQNITQKDIDAVIEALQADFLTQGPRINEFEENFAQYIGVQYAVAVANGTAALHLNVLALDLQPGEKVITTSITFAASANCVRYAGGEVLFADIDPETYLIDIGSVRDLLKKHPKGSIKGIIPVDFAGRAVDLEAFRKLADEFDCWLIEDACHAPGGFFTDSNEKKQWCGNGKFADLAIFSFHPVKHIAAGEGGMITTNDKKLYERLLSLRTHGIHKDQTKFTNSIEFAEGIDRSKNQNQSSEALAKEETTTHNSQLITHNFPAWYMEMTELGFNYRLTDFQAALGNSQLQRADKGLKKRREIASKYAEAFKGKPYIKGQSGVVEGHAYHLYIIEVEDRLGLYNYLRENNIFAQIHYIPCHLMPYYRKFGWQEGDLPNAENYYKHCISLPMYPTLDINEQLFIIEKIIEYYG